MAAEQHRQSSHQVLTSSADALPVDVHAKSIHAAVGNRDDAPPVRDASGIQHAASRTGPANRRPASSPVRTALGAAIRRPARQPPGPVPAAYEIQRASAAADTDPDRARSETAPLPAGGGAVPPDAYSVTLWGVLAAADARNPNVALARERINEAYARAERADFLWLPNLRVGGNYHHHEGPVQNSGGNIVETNRSSLYGGFGAGTIGGGTPGQPGLAAQFHVTDAIFQPRIAGHVAASRQFGAAAARNDILRNTAVAYLELVRAEFSVAVGQEALTNTRTLHDLAGNYARSGQGLQSDFERMQTELALRSADLVRRREGVHVASARLAQLLHSDPSVPIVSGEPMAIPLVILDAGATAAQFVATGLSRRPELAEQQHLVRAAVERYNREKYAPLVPTVLLGLSYGGMGGGQGSTISSTDDRWDADAMAVWEIRNLGIGERNTRRENSSLVTQEQHRGAALMDQVAREVVEAHAQVVRRQERIAIAREAIVAAENSHRLNLERIGNAQGLPIEVLQSIQALAAARDAYLGAVIDYNIAQFDLCRAIGWFVKESPQRN